MTTPIRLRAVLKYNKKNVPLLLVLARLIYAKMIASQTIFVSPPVTMLVFNQQTSDLADSEQGVKNGLVKASMRETKRVVVVTSLTLLVAYVQSLADAAGEQSAALIQAAGMTVAAFPVRSKPILAATLDTQSGAVVLRANGTLLSTSKSKRGRLFSWQFTLDGGKTWITAPPTTVTKTTITGLTPLVTVGFRVNLTDSGGPGAWTQTVSIIVH